MISKYKNFVLTTFYIVPPYFKSLNNGQNLTIISFRSSFNQNHFSEKVDYRLLLGQTIQSQLT